MLNCVIANIQENEGRNYFPREPHVGQPCSKLLRLFLKRYLGEIWGFEGSDTSIFWLRVNWYRVPVVWEGCLPSIKVEEVCCWGRQPLPSWFWWPLKAQRRFTEGRNAKHKFVHPWLYRSLAVVRRWPKGRFHVVVSTWSTCTQLCRHRRTMHGFADSWNTENLTLTWLSLIILLKGMRARNMSWRVRRGMKSCVAFLTLKFGTNGTAEVSVLTPAAFYPKGNSLLLVSVGGYWKRAEGIDHLKNFTRPYREQNPRQAVLWSASSYKNPSS